jgi:hypothetical protein
VGAGGERRGWRVTAEHNTQPGTVRPVWKRAVE